MKRAGSLLERGLFSECCATLFFEGPAKTRLFTAAKQELESGGSAIK
jgi:hypothetical protein